jgi:hypothetical protein
MEQVIETISNFIKNLYTDMRKEFGKLFAEDKDSEKYLLELTNGQKVTFPLQINGSQILYSLHPIDKESVRTVQHKRMDKNNTSCVVRFGGLGHYENSNDIARSAIDITKDDYFYVCKSWSHFFFKDKDSSQTVANRLNTINIEQYDTIKVVSNSWGNTDALQFVKKMLTEHKKVHWEIVEVANELLYYCSSTTFLSELQEFIKPALEHREPETTRCFRLGDTKQEALDFSLLTFGLPEKERQSYMDGVLHPPGDMTTLKNSIPREMVTQPRAMIIEIYSKKQKFSTPGEMVTNPSAEAENKEKELFSI